MAPKAKGPFALFSDDSNSFVPLFSPVLMVMLYIHGIFIIQQDSWFAYAQFLERINIDTTHFPMSPSISGERLLMWSKSSCLVLFKGWFLQKGFKGVLFVYWRFCPGFSSRVAKEGVQKLYFCLFFFPLGAFSRLLHQLHFQAVEQWKVLVTVERQKSRRGHCSLGQSCLQEAAGMLTLISIYCNMKSKGRLTVILPRRQEKRKKKYLSSHTVLSPCRKI